METGKKIETKEWLRPASSGLEPIFSKLWVADEPKAVLQVAHGMAEHIGRYEDFARFMAERGYVVCMNDHAGHGSHAETLGYFAQKDGMGCVTRDMKALMDEVTAQYAGLPVFLLGHSMGSFLTRKYLTLYGAGLSGCILSGTAGANPALGIGIALAMLQKKLKGPKSEGRLLQIIAFGAFTKRIKNPVNRAAWLSTVDEVCLSFRKDRLCGFSFTAGGFYDLFKLMGEVNKKDWAGKVPKALPIYIFSGDQDPVGNYGKGVIEVYDKLRASGQENLTLKLYPGGRHEMLNEANKEEVYEDILNWLEALL